MTQARAALELQLSAATEAAQSEWQRAESAAEELEEVRGDNQRLLAALEEARGDIERLSAALEEAKATRLPEIASGPISPSEIEAMRAAAVAHVLRQSEDRAVAAAALTAAGNAAVERLSPEAYAALSTLTLSLTLTPTLTRTARTR